VFARAGNAGDSRRKIRQMITNAQKQLFLKLKRSQYAYLRSLSDVGLVDLEDIDAIISQIVQDRLGLGEEFLREAKGLSPQSDITRRVMISHCYYTQYHAARAVILHVHRQDCDGHDQLPVEIEKVLGTGPTDVLKRLRDKRNQVMYEPYVDLDLLADVTAALTESEGFLNACKTLLRKRGLNV
jgi:uncharacterized protein (UPF0332 family)